MFTTYDALAKLKAKGLIPESVVAMTILLEPNSLVEVFQYTADGKINESNLIWSGVPMTSNEFYLEHKEDLNLPDNAEYVRIEFDYDEIVRTHTTSTATKHGLSVLEGYEFKSN